MTDTTNSPPRQLAGAVSENAIAHLLIRDGLNQAICSAVRNYSMNNMADADDHHSGYPLVDLMSNPAPADIVTGEMEMISLTDEIAAAVQTFASDQSATIKRLETEVTAWREQAINESWSHNLEKAYGRAEYEKSLKKQLDELIAKRIENGLFDS